MKKNKLIVLIVSIIMLTMVIAIGCGQDKTPDANGGSEGSPEKISLRVAGQHPADHVATAALKKIKERVESESDGRIELILYPGNQLGDYTLVYEEVMRGSIDIAHIFIPSQYDEKLEITSIPYLVQDYEEMKKVFSPGSFMYEKYEELHQNLGVKLLGIYAEGFIGVGTKKRPDNPADPQGNKNVLIRIAPLEVYKLAAEGLGFTTTTIPYADLYSALQTGVADGWIGGPPALNYLSFRDVINYYMPYNTFIENTSYLINYDLWNSLSEEDQKIIADAFQAEAMASFDLSKAEDEKYMDLMAQEGIEVIEFSDEELSAFANHIRETCWPKLTDRFGEDIMQGILEDLK
jgi:TRAP-type C4-dicarboxylate transport system substrate-binding protein